MGILSTLRLALVAYAVVTNCAAVPGWANSEQIQRTARQLFGRQDPPPLSEYSFRFESITPCERIEWVDCYDTFKCARLKVPLDYNDHSKGSAAVAVMMLPANPDVPFLGTIFSHPGGAGNPSEPFFLAVAHTFRDVILGAGWNFVTFDARGAGQTTPTLTCFATQEERYAFEQRGRALPPIVKSTDSWSKWQSYYRDYNAKCQALSGDVIPYLGFIQTTRDLVSIATAMGETKINFWGFSNGANIGALLVALYPERLGNLVLDSVSKITERFSPGTSVEFELQDHGKMLSYFFDACHSTGSTAGCAFYDTNVATMNTRYAAIEKALLANPISFTSPQPGTYNVENFKSDVFLIISGNAGPPAYLWPFLGAFLADVESVTKGGTPGDALQTVYGGGFAPRSVSPPVNGRQQGGTDAQQGIPCTDSGPLGRLSQGDFEAKLSSFNRKDPHFGTLFLQQYLVCSGTLHFVTMLCCMLYTDTSDT
ncbi:hypothetical protein ABW21_db0209024 [Orbilia brochopaga]|nr:hypothetical protein ABW21_db0209024 [Drechslerella brochopaga]